MKTRKLSLFLSLATFFFASPLLATSEQDELWFFVLVKSNNHSQSMDGELKLLNYHFFSELFGKEQGKIKSASLTRLDKDEAIFEYEDRGEAFYYEGGHFNTLEAVDNAHPNTDYRFQIQLSSGESMDATLALRGPDGKTDIPAPIHIYFYQQGKKIRQDQVNPELPLLVKWSPYSNGRADVNDIVDDMIFLVFQNCHGERVFHTGLPFKEANYTKYSVTEMEVPADRFKAGQTYALFVEFPHVVDSAIAQGIPGFSSYATATYTDIRTSGELNDSECPDKTPPLDTGQTDRMEVEIK